MPENSSLKARLEQLRDQLQSISDTYSTLSLYLGEVNALSDLVNSDYYDLQHASPETMQRLAEWRAIERSIFHSLKRHAHNQFKSYKETEAKFMERLKTSGERLVTQNNADIRMKVQRFKEGIVAMKYAAEARRRVTHIADFIMTVKAVTGRDAYDYYDNLIILHSLAQWTKEVVRDCARCTSKNPEHFRNEGSSGQIVYANSVLRNILDYCAANTVFDDSAQASLGHQLVEYLLSHPVLPSDDMPKPSLSLKGDEGRSKITYSIFNLLQDLDSGRMEPGKLAPFLQVFRRLGLDLSIPRPIHIYRIQEYYVHTAISQGYLDLIHSTQQGVLQTVSDTLATDLLKSIRSVLKESESSDLDVSSILVALRAAKYMSDSGKKKLLGVWSGLPFVKPYLPKS
ncbi:ATP synthase F1 subunit delta [Babesia caballi]|uniref:ATP synthase F1 subunit delta n=1 Tax=Babesia caballi TaxID=5871 RepID=A0AAV4LV47_BABCB|nr:ATP synthase F1 subunit delta [Babesia caballi]